MEKIIAMVFFLFSIYLEKVLDDIVQNGRCPLNDPLPLLGEFLCDGCCGAALFVCVCCSERAAGIMFYIIVTF